MQRERRLIQDRLQIAKLPGFAVFLSFSDFAIPVVLGARKTILKKIWEAGKMSMLVFAPLPIL